MTSPSSITAHLTRRVTIAGITALVVVAVIATLAVQRASGGDSSIAAAPAFSTAQLAARPGANWITNGGSLANDRYSPLAQVNTTNGGRRKGPWHNPPKTGIAQQESARAPPPRL